MKRDEASSTAKVIAASTLLLASDAATAALVAPGAAELSRRFLSRSPRDRLLAWSAANPFTRVLWRLLERLTYPGITKHYWHRKRWIERQCRSAIDGGCSRLLVIGAGFDTLGFRLAQDYAWLQVIEIDHPATQRVKRLALTDDSVAVPPNLRFEAVDLAEAELPVSCLEGRESTVVVMEGLLMYLPLVQVEALLQRLASAPPSRLQVVFTCMSQWPDGSSGFRPRSWLIERWMAGRGEPFLWTIQPERIVGLLEAKGLRLTELTVTGVLEGENLVTCERVASVASAEAVHHP